MKEGAKTTETLGRRKLLTIIKLKVVRFIGYKQAMNSAMKRPSYKGRREILEGQGQNCKMSPVRAEIFVDRAL